MSDIARQTELLISAASIMSCVPSLTSLPQGPADDLAHAHALDGDVHQTSVASSPAAAQQCNAVLLYFFLFLLLSFSPLATMLAISVSHAYALSWVTNI